MDEVQANDEEITGASLRGTKSGDIPGWEKIDSQEAVEKLMLHFENFNYSCIHEIHFWTGIWVDPKRSMSWSELYANYVRVLFQRQREKPIAIEVIFEDVFDMHYNIYVQPGFAPEGIVSAFMRYEQGVLYWSDDREFMADLVGLNAETENRERQYSLAYAFWTNFYKAWRAIFRSRYSKKDQKTPDADSSDNIPTTMPKFPLTLSQEGHQDAFATNGRKWLPTWIVAKAAYWREADNWIGRETRYGPKDKWDARAKDKTIWFDNADKD